MNTDEHLVKGVDTLFHIRSSKEGSAKHNRITAHHFYKNLSLAGNESQGTKRKRDTELVEGA